MVSARGFAVEQHFVTTEDGYINRMFRIPGRIGDIVSAVPRGPPVILMHGLIDSSDAWVINDDQSPAFILADKGYDVWLPNMRGNKYSKNHTTLSVQSEEYWDYSWEECGVYDLPAFTDYVLEHSTY